MMNREQTGAAVYPSCTLYLYKVAKCINKRILVFEPCITKISERKFEGRSDENKSGNPTSA
jgi:hypothetical protein